MSHVTLKCSKCGYIGFFNSDESHKKINGIIKKHKTGDFAKHRIWVMRSEY